MGKTILWKTAALAAVGMMLVTGMCGCVGSENTDSSMYPDEGAEKEKPSGENSSTNASETQQPEQEEEKQLNEAKMVFSGHIYGVACYVETPVQSFYFRAGSYSNDSINITFPKNLTKFEVWLEYATDPVPNALMLRMLERKGGTAVYSNASGTYFEGESPILISDSGENLSKNVAAYGKDWTIKIEAWECVYCDFTVTVTFWYWEGE